MQFDACCQSNAFPDFDEGRFRYADVLVANDLRDHLYPTEKHALQFYDVTIHQKKCDLLSGETVMKKSTHEQCLQKILIGCASTVIGIRFVC